MQRMSESSKNDGIWEHKCHNLHARYYTLHAPAKDCLNKFHTPQNEQRTDKPVSPMLYYIVIIIVLPIFSSLGCFALFPRAIEPQQRGKHPLCTYTLSPLSDLFPLENGMTPITYRCVTVYLNDDWTQTLANCDNHLQPASSKWIRHSKARHSHRIYFRRVFLRSKCSSLSFLFFLCFFSGLTLQSSLSIATVAANELFSFIWGILHEYQRRCMCNVHVTRECCVLTIDCIFSDLNSFFVLSTLLIAL